MRISKQLKALADERREVQRDLGDATQKREKAEGDLYDDPSDDNFAALEEARQREAELQEEWEDIEARYKQAWDQEFPL